MDSANPAYGSTDRAERVATLEVSPPRLVLASASPARLALLRAGGIDPVVSVSTVDEDAVVARLPGGISIRTVCAELARAKAMEVAARFKEPGFLVIGADSILEFDSAAYGKPRAADVARDRWRSLAGQSGTLHTGHFLVESATQRHADAVSSTTVHFATPSAHEIDAYVASGEPLEVAGAFTLDGIGGAFVDRIEGSPSGVIGLSIPTLRNLVRELGYDYVDLWAAGDSA